MLPHAEVFIDEAMRARPEILVELARLQPFPVTLLDAGGQPVAGEFHVLDRCGAAEPCTWYDPRRGQRGFYSERTPLRLSSTACDAQGHAVLLAPVDERELVVAVPRGGRDVWIPLVLPAPGRPIMLTLPQ